MTRRRALMTCAGVIALAAGLDAQATKTSEPAGAAKVTTTQMSGEVVSVEGSTLLVKMQPDGTYRVFNVPPGRQFMIDGQSKTVGELKPGTFLKATVTSTEQPVTERTTTVTNGTVWFVDKNTNHLILTLENGENRSYDVPPGYKFTVEGRPATIQDLRKGMKVSGSKIVSQPVTSMSTDTTVTGTAPK